MKVVITDVSVFFEIYQLEILPEFFGLDLEIHTTNFIYNEITREAQVTDFKVFVRSKKLHIISITAEEEEEIKTMQLKRSNRSFPDKTVLWKAKQLNCAILTSDSKLREEAINQDIEVHGSVWVVKELWDKGIINAKYCIDLLENMKMNNERSPVNEIDRLIEQLKRKPKPLE